MKSIDATINKRKVIVLCMSLKLIEYWTDMLWSSPVTRNRIQLFAVFLNQPWLIQCILFISRKLWITAGASIILLGSEISKAVWEYFLHGRFSSILGSFTAFYRSYRRSIEYAEFRGTYVIYAGFKNHENLNQTS